jgi:hypothetical protein
MRAPATLSGRVSTNRARAFAAPLFGTDGLIVAASMIVQTFWFNTGLVLIDSSGLWNRSAANADR